MSDYTVTVPSGPYATVRAWEKAKRLYGDSVRLGGIVGPTWGRQYTYEVEVDSIIEGDE